MMLAYAGSEGAGAGSLITDQGIPYLHFALAQVEADYGSIEVFLGEERGVDAPDLALPRDLYLVATFLGS